MTESSNNFHAVINNLFQVFDSYCLPSLLYFVLQQLPLKSITRHNSNSLQWWLQSSSNHNRCHSRCHSSNRNNNSSSRRRNSLSSSNHHSNNSGPCRREAEPRTRSARSEAWRSSTRIPGAISRRTYDRTVAARASLHRSRRRLVSGQPRDR